MTVAQKKAAAGGEDGSDVKGSNVVPLRVEPKLPEVRDREFLPAALEILETPPSPVKIAVLVTICLFVAAALAWSYFGRLEIYAIAQGKIQPTGRIKVVQPLESGKVTDVLVKEGQRVKEGDPLVRLDPTETLADQTAIRQEWISARAEILRRTAALLYLMRKEGDALPPVVWDQDIPSDVRQREERVLAADLAELAANVANLKAQMVQKQAEKSRLGKSIDAQKAFISTLGERVKMREELLQKSAGTRSSLIDAMQEFRQAEVSLASQEGQLEESEASQQVISTSIQRLNDTFISDATRKLSDARIRADDAKQRFAKAAARAVRTTMVSPGNGLVQSLSVTTIGQVVTTGQELMRLVPEDAPLEIEAYILNRDIGFVKAGQDVVLKIDSFPFTRFGTLTGKVSRIATDAVSGADAARAQADPTRASGGPVAGTQPNDAPQGLVYKAIIVPDTDAISVYGQMVPLQAGMSVTVEVSTGSRRLIEYLFSPLVEISSRAMRER